MGDLTVKGGVDPHERRIFMQCLLEDVDTLEQMLGRGDLETDVTRIGAEQELFLVDSCMRPAPMALEVLAALDDPHFTTELARFNLEFNLDPLRIAPGCLSALSVQLREHLDKVRRSAAEFGLHVVMTGILPTLDKNDLGFENMTPAPRYRALSDAMRSLRGTDFMLHIKGRDELLVRHDNVMMESCNTSFQVHLQVDPARFAALYNLAQAVAAPVLAASTFSPVLFGKRLWRETRIAVFQQAVDTRPGTSHRRHWQPRVSFGSRWLESSVLEIFREDIARYRLVISQSIDDRKARKGDGPPKLTALRLHNGTVYRWNRPCYGISDGKPHLRIENRYLPSGPSVVDEVANAAFWVGLIRGLDLELGDISRHLRFGQAKENFLAASRLGLAAELIWTDDRSLPAAKLIQDELLPLARHGLKDLGILDDGAQYLDALEERVRCGRTGSAWILDSLTKIADQGSSSQRMASITRSIIDNQTGGEPVHTWPSAELLPNRSSDEHHTTVRTLMTSDLFTVSADEVLDLVASLMDWRHIRHVPVEDADHRLVGLITHRRLLRVLARRWGKPREPISVREVMETNVVTVEPDTPTLEALRIMKRHRIACLPVVEEGQLVGILTERDFVRLADPLLEAALGLQACPSKEIPSVLPTRQRNS